MGSMRCVLVGNMQVIAGSINIFIRNGSENIFECYCIIGYYSGLPGMNFRVILLAGGYTAG